MKRNREKSEVLRHHELWFRSPPKTNVMKAIGHLFFDFRGRISCGKWWLLKAVWLLILYVSTSLIPWDYLNQFRFGNGSIGVLITYLWWILVVWVALVLNLKRLHDRNLPGWWLLVGLIPILGFIYCTRELLSAGDEGKNRYGPAPKPLF